MERTLNDSYVADAYDELLSQGEIQGHLNKVNLMITLEKLSLAVREGRDGELLQILFSKSLNLKNTIKKGLSVLSVFNLYHCSHTFSNQIELRLICLNFAASWIRLDRTFFR